jgi:hypothetical protein
MKGRISIVAVVVTALGLMFLPHTNAAPARIFTERLRARIDNPCTGEKVFIKGRTRLVDSSFFHGDRFHFVVHARFNVVAVGLDSGIEYRAIENFTFASNEVVTGSPQDVQTAEAILRLIATGSADDFFLHNKVQITINANGEVTSFFTELGEVTCHG